MKSQQFRTWEKHLESAFMPGETVGLDESMIKSFHKNIQGKMKIIWKSCPVGNEINYMVDGHSKIVVNIEFYEGKDEMQEKSK